MQLSMPGLSLVERTVLVYRLLTVALAGLAFVLTGGSSDPRVPSLGASYLSAVVVSWLLSSRVSWKWLVHLVVLIDVAAVTTAVSLMPQVPLPLWALYLLPVGAAAMVGNELAAMAAMLSIAGYLVAIWVSTNSLPVLVFWPATVLAVATFLVVTLSARWLAERHEKRAWQQLAAAQRGLEGIDGVEQAAAAVSEWGRRLVKADRVWLWWCDDAGRLQLAWQGGRASEVPLTPDSLPPGLTRKLKRGPIELSELDGFAGVVGELSLLRHKEDSVGLLGLAWGAAPMARTDRRERLRVFAPSAAAAIVQAQRHAALQDQVRREMVLRQAAEELAATLDWELSQEVLLNATRSGLGASAALVERRSGRILTGDVEVADALLRHTIEVEASGSEVVESPAVEKEVEPPLSVAIEPNLALLAWRTTPPLTDGEADWLGQLAKLARAKAATCATHDAVLAEEQRLRETLESAPVPLVLRDDSGAILMSNAAYRVLGEVEPAACPEEDATAVWEEEVAIGDPPRIFVAMSARLPERDRFLTAFREITRERDELRAKEELIAMVGHELRSPLTSIYGYSQLMARQLGVVQQQVNQLNRLIGDFVDAAQMEGGKLPLSSEPVDLAEIARAAAERFRGAHEGRRLRLQLADVPPVEGDPARLTQVVDNLLNNADKYSGQGQDIVLTVGVRDGEVALSVRDNGIGIAPEHLPHLFDRFYRAPNPDAQQVKGLGLGLSIVRDLVTAHGGRAWAESAGPGQGSTFWVALPAADVRGGEQLLQAAGTG